MVTVATRRALPRLSGGTISGRLIIDCREVVGVKYFYSEIDGVTLTYGDIVDDGTLETVPVYFERDDGEGDFDFAEGSLPTCYFPRSRGFSELELEELARFLKDNMVAIYDDARHCR